MFPEAELLKICRLAPGKRYERSTQRSDEMALRDYYGHQGYIAHPSLGDTSWRFLEPDLKFDSQKHEVEVTYRIRQGRKRVIREVLFHGAEYTRDRVLRREVSVLPGQVADIKEITRSLSRLYETSYFQDDMANEEHKDPVYSFIDVKDPEHPELVDLRYEVEEGRVINFEIQGGSDSNTGIFGRIALRMKNFDIGNWPSSLGSAPSEIYHKEAFHGAGQLLNLELRPGVAETGSSILFITVDLFGSEFNPYSLSFDINRRRESFKNYDEDRLDRDPHREVAQPEPLRVRRLHEPGHRRQRHLRPLTGIFQPDGGSLPQGSTTRRETDLIGGLFEVHYRALDTGLNPREGFSVNWANGVYGGAFGGDWEFVKSNLDIDAYWQMGTRGPRPSRIPRRARRRRRRRLRRHGGGAVHRRFYSGGSVEGRGFAYHGIGPNVGDVPIGGSTELNGTIEYRIPLYKVVQPGSYREQEIFRMTLFTDAVILNPNPFEVDFNELRASVGFGFASRTRS